MVKFNRNRPRPQGGKFLKNRPRKFVSSGKRNPNGKPAFKPKKKFSQRVKSVDQLDKELELYWGNEVGSKHLDQEMDEYWKNKKQDPEE